MIKFKSTRSTVLQILGGTESCSLFCFVLVCFLILVLLALEALV